MAITVRTSTNPTTMANNWASRVAASGTAWLNGINSPRRLPNANPAAATSNWTAGVAGAAKTYEAGISGPNYLANLSAGATAKQASYTGSGNAKKANAQAAFTKVAAAIDAILPTLPARGPAGTNTARSTAFQEAMHARKGTLRVT
jgi:hypothetical protein